ncbi:MAG: hypothetical protein RLN81_11510 [Balneolaceae bacterium]
MKNSLFALLLVLTTTITCAKQPEPSRTFFNVSVSVADSIDQTGDYSGFSFLIYNRTDPDAAADTMFFDVTDTNGNISGIIEIEKEGVYPVQISRNGVNLASLRLIIADQDTINLTGEFPELGKTLEIDSYEARTMKKYDRVNAGFQRTNSFIMAGRVADSLIYGELEKWSELFWDVYEENKGTFASKFALESAISLLDRYNKPQMFNKLNQAYDEELSFGLGVTLGKKYLAEYYGLERAISYLDSLKSITDNDQIVRSVDQALVKINFDSARVEEAEKLLTAYDKKYNRSEELSFWYKNIRFELTYLAPGMQIPDFSFETVEGATVSRDSLLGKVYVLDFGLMANQLYQEQYDESTVIYQIYAPQGLEYYTIPFDPSANTIIGFFQERTRFWDLADPPSFDKNQLIDRFNLQFFPSRILVDAEGKIVRKFVGQEFEELIPAITNTLSQTN